MNNEQSGLPAEIEAAVKNSETRHYNPMEREVAISERLVGARIALSHTTPSEPAGDLVERMHDAIEDHTETVSGSDFYADAVDVDKAAKACAEIAQQECQNKAVGFADWSVQSPYARFGPDKWGLGDGTFITTSDLYSEYLKINPAQ